MTEHFQETIKALAALRVAAAPWLPLVGCFSLEVTSSTLTGVVID